MSLKDKVQKIYDQLLILRPSLKKINITDFNNLPVQLTELLFERNNLQLFLNSSVEHISEHELKNMTSIFDSCFLNQTKLKSIILPEGLLSIGMSAFSNCTSLESINIPNSVVTIDSSAFYGCDSLSELVIPGGITNLGSQAFAYCDNLEKVIISEGITTLSMNIFAYNIALIEVVLPNSLVSISDQAFWKCTNLSDVDVPSSVTSIGLNAFRDTNLTNLYMHSVTPPTLGNVLAIPYNADLKIHVPVGSGQAYKTATNWSGRAAMIIEDPEV